MKLANIFLPPPHPHAQTWTHFFRHRPFLSMGHCVLFATLCSELEMIYTYLSKWALYFFSYSNSSFSFSVRDTILAPLSCIYSWFVENVLLSYTWSHRQRDSAYKAEEWYTCRCCNWNKSFLISTSCRRSFKFWATWLLCVCTLAHTQANKKEWRLACSCLRV